MFCVLSVNKACSFARQPNGCEMLRKLCVKETSFVYSSKTLNRKLTVGVLNSLRQCSSIASTQLTNVKFTRSCAKQDATVGKGQFISRNLRDMSSYTPISIPLAASGTAVTKDESRDFMAVFPDIVRDLTDADRKSDMSTANKLFSKALQYNVPGGKKNRGLAVVFAFKMLASKEQLTPENIRKAQILGWCVELLQAFLLVIDDVMDNAITRRGRPCWYRYNNLGLTAINHGILMENGIFVLLKKYFRDEPYYINILELFHDVIFKTCTGQTLDMLASQTGKKPDYKTFTMDQYNAIVKYKTAYYSFHLPVALAMHMTGFKDAEVLRQAKTILLEMGQFFQVQDDFLDCFGDPEVTGKVGTDIEDGKCSWLAVVALQRASPEQKKFFIENYASKDASKVSAIKGLYEQLGLPAMFTVYEEESYHLIVTHIQQLSRGMPHELFFKFLEKIYKRDS